MKISRQEWDTIGKGHWLANWTLPFATFSLEKQGDSYVRTEQINLFYRLCMLPVLTIIAFFVFMWDGGLKEFFAELPTGFGLLDGYSHKDCFNPKLNEKKFKICEEIYNKHLDK